MRRLLVLVLVVAGLYVLATRLDPNELRGEALDRLGIGGEAERAKAVVVTVRDGDTIRVRIAGTGVEEEVRVLGIDTPEVRDPAECGGQVATRSMLGLTPVGSTVTLVSDPSQGDRDVYGRLLRYVTRSGADVGLRQVEAGLAKVFVFQDDPFDRVGAYRKAQRRARAGDTGSWAACWR